MALLVGIQHLRDDVNPQAPNGAPMSIIGLIGTAPSADGTAFPVNTPKMVRTNDTALRALLGTTGTIVDALEGISAQMDDETTAAQVVVVRVTDNVDPWQVITSIVGNEANQTGLWAFLKAGEDIGYEPRLLIAPGYTSQQQQGLGTPNIVAGGTGGANGTFALAFTGGTGSGAAGTFTVAGGAVTNVTITDPGVYTVAPTLSFAASTGLTGQNVTVSLIKLANPVAALLPTVAGRLNGHFIPDGPTSSEQNWIDWLETLAETSACLHPLAQAGQKLNSQGNTVSVPLSPYIAGLYSKIDAQNDGRPFRSVANRPLLGLVGVTPTIPMSYIDGSSKGQDYIGRNGGIVARGQSGVIGAVARSGFVFWGDATMSADTNYLFANVARGRTFIELTNASAQAYYLGKFNITAQVATAIANTLEGILSIAKAEREILDYKISFDPGLNTTGELRQGKLDITFNAEEAPTLRKITFRSRRYEKALTNLTQQIAIQLGGVTQA